MFLPKTIYEALPFFYFLAGALFLSGAAYIAHWYTGAFAYSYIGYFCFFVGLLVGLHRLVYRRQARRRAHDAENAGA